jgi:hypothetical protein
MLCLAAMQVNPTNLTNLTELSFDVDDSNANISAASQLLTSLQALDITAPSVPGAFLTSITQLRSLTIYQNVLPQPSVLQDIARSLKQLTHVHVGAKALPAYPADIMDALMGCQEAQDMGEALAALPLRGLNLRRSGLTFLVPELHRMTQLTGLTLLNLHPEYLLEGFSIMSQQLQKLTALQQLELEGELHGLLVGLPAGFLDTPVQQPDGFLRTIASLPELQQLSLTGMQLGDAALQLLAATQLTDLRLSGCKCSADVHKALRDAVRCDVLDEDSSDSDW